MIFVLDYKVYSSTGVVPRQRGTKLSRQLWRVRSKSKTEGGHLTLSVSSRKEQRQTVSNYFPSSEEHSSQCGLYSHVSLSSAIVTSTRVTTRHRSLTSLYFGFLILALQFPICTLCPRLCQTNTCLIRTTTKVTAIGKSMLGA